MINKLENDSLKPGLYLVPTPIGNLGDITLRALDILQKCDIIAAEDTRSANILLKHFEIKGKSLISYYDEKESERSPLLINEISNGKSIALISEAGSPIISDPGYRIVQSAIERNIHLEALPGPTAFVPALQLSGLPCHNFAFYGFPPAKKNRNKFFENLKNNNITAILYESPFKIIKTLNDLIKILGGDRRASLSREITKIYEETIRGTLSEILSELEKKQSIKGEIVLVIAGD